MLADGNADFALQMGVELDLTSKSLGIRSRRYAMIVDDLIVRTLSQGFSLPGTRSGTMLHKLSV
jgi:peroxiredoxin